MNTRGRSRIWFDQGLIEPQGTIKSCGCIFETSKVKPRLQPHDEGKKEAHQPDATSEHMITNVAGLKYAESHSSESHSTEARSEERDIRRREYDIV